MPFDQQIAQARDMNDTARSLMVVHLDAPVAGIGSLWCTDGSAKPRFTAVAKVISC
jgi:hypothetical protein